MKKPFDDLHANERTTLLFLFKHFLAGSFGGFLLGSLILLTDMNKIGTMIYNSPDGILFALMMFMGLILTFGSMGMGLGIFGLAQEKDDPPSSENYY